MSTQNVNTLGKILRNSRRIGGSFGSRTLKHPHRPMLATRRLRLDLKTMPSRQNSLSDACLKRRKSCAPTALQAVKLLAPQVNKNSRPLDANSKPGSVAPSRIRRNETRSLRSFFAARFSFCRHRLRPEKNRCARSRGHLQRLCPASAAAVFTQNLVVAPPVTVSKANLRASKGRMRGVVVNAGNANCATGAEGLLAAQRTVAEAARRLNCKPEEMFVCSTGVIGVPLALDKSSAASASLAPRSAPVRRVRSPNSRSPSAPPTRAPKPPPHPSRWPASACTWSAAPRAQA